VAGEQVAGYRVDIRYKSGKKESIQARQVEGVAGEVAEEPLTERSALANDPPRSTWLASQRAGDGLRQIWHLFRSTPP
jgi:hypothetical protein